MKKADGQDAFTHRLLIPIGRAEPGLWPSMIRVCVAPVLLDRLVRPFGASRARIPRPRIVESPPRRNSPEAARRDYS